MEEPAAPEKPIVFTRHALERCRTQGATEEDVVRAIREGKREAAQRNLWLYRHNLEFRREWAGTWYAVQQVAPVVDEEAERLVVITVFTFYF